MIPGSRIERLIMQADDVLNGLESDAIERLDAALRAAFARLETELEPRYRRTIRETRLLGYETREARARILSEELRALLTLTGSTPPELASLITSSAQTAIDNTLELLTEYQRDLIRMSTGVPIDVAAAATNSRARLIHHGAEFATKAESAIIQGIVSGRSWGKVSSDLRDELKITRSRAEGIVRYESVAAADEARRATYEANGVPMTQLYTTADRRVCGYCASRAGNIYKLGDLVLPLHHRCRCYSAPVRPSWFRLGLMDTEFHERHRKEAIKKLEAEGGKLKRGAAPAERYRGRETAPTPLWTPGQEWTG